MTRQTPPVIARYLLMSGLFLCASIVSGQSDDARRISIGRPEVLPDQVITRIQINDANDLISGDLDLVFDASEFDILEIRNADLLSGFALFSNQIGDTLKVSFASAQPTSGAGTLFEIVTRGTVIPTFQFSLVSLNGDQIEVVYERVTAIRQPVNRADVAVDDGLWIYPNPFNADAVVSVDITRPGAVQVALYNMAGQLVRVLVQKEVAMGRHEYHWDGRDHAGLQVASGVYVARLSTTRQVEMTRLTLLR